MPTDPLVQPWAIRSALVAVADLDRSVSFYRELGPFEELAREGAVAMLGTASPASIALILRETQSIHHTRHGPQSLGVRSITFNVWSSSELDRIESVLHGRNLLTFRREIADGASNSYTGGIRTISRWRSCTTPKTSRSDLITTERSRIWFIPWTLDRARNGARWRSHGTPSHDRRRRQRSTPRPLVENFGLVHPWLLIPLPPRRNSPTPASANFGLGWVPAN